MGGSPRNRGNVANLTLLRFDGSRPETSRRDRRIGETAPLIGSSSSPELADPASTPALARIFIVEDNPGVRNVLSLVLMREGYEVLTALQGAAALERVARWRPDLILLDMMMPVMDGEDFLRSKEADPAVADVPVVVVTANRYRRDATTYASVRDWIQKPIRFDRLVRAIGNC